MALARSAHGKLAVLLPGMGAVATTLMAGVSLVRRGLGVPVGSIAQLGTLPRDGSEAAGGDPKVRDVIPLAGARSASSSPAGTSSPRTPTPRPSTRAS